VAISSECERTGQSDSPVAAGDQHYSAHLMLQGFVVICQVARSQAIGLEELTRSVSTASQPMSSPAKGE
jgi:hypothetical protein